MTTSSTMPPSTTSTSPPTTQVEVTSTTARRASTTSNRHQQHALHRGPGYTFADPAGRRIIDSAQIADTFRPTALVPGAVLTATTPFDPRTCQTQPCPPLVPGTYSASATWTFPGGPFEVRTPFDFTA